MINKNLWLPFFVCSLVACGGGSSNSSESTTNPPNEEIKPIENANFTIENLSENKYKINLNLDSIAKKFTIPTSVFKQYSKCGEENLNFENVVVVIKNSKIEKDFFVTVKCGNKAEFEVSDLTAGDWSINVVAMGNGELINSENSINIQSSSTVRKNINFKQDESNEKIYQILSNPDLPSLYESYHNQFPKYENIDDKGYIHLISSQNDYIGEGKQFIYTNQEFNLSSNLNKMKINVNGFDGRDGTGEFALPLSADKIEIGLYSNLLRYPFHNEVIGGLSWSGNGRGCNTSNSWLKVEQVTYENGAIRSMDFRFAQHCEKDPYSALFAKVHWKSTDKSLGFDWQPNLNTIPKGSYVALESDGSDYIGLGKKYLYSASNAIIKVNTSGSYLNVSVRGDEQWQGDFKLPESKIKLEKGLYQNLLRYPFNNPVKGGLSWTGDGRGCNNSNGWIAVDNVVYEGDTLKSIDLRFNQSCDNSMGILKGKLHWDQ